MCQGIISMAEREAARRSPFALYRIDKGPPPRNNRRPDSGSVESRYALVKDWTGGYIEVVLRARRDPIPLPCIELDVATLNCRRHGVTPEDMDRLVQGILSVVEGPPDESGLLGDVAVELLSEAEADIRSDPDFWPRVFLDLSGQLKIRARDVEEAKRVFEAAVKLARLGVFKDHSRWATGEVPGGTPHRVCLEWDDRALLRVVAKIAYATACLQAAPGELESESLRQLRRFVLGNQDHDATLPVRQISPAKSITEWPDHHVVLIESNRGQLHGVVDLYGTCFFVDLGKDPLPAVFARPVVAMSRKDGTHTHLANGDVRDIVVETLRCYVERITDESSSGIHVASSESTNGIWPQEPATKGALDSARLRIRL
jgi:hypothetical protein